MGILLSKGRRGSTYILQKVGEEVHTYSQHYAMELTITWTFKFVLNSLLNVPLGAYYTYINKQCCLLSFF